MLGESKAWNKNLAMCWIDYKKAFDMVPHSLILECLAMFGVTGNIRVLLANTMKSWQTVLTSNGVNLGDVNIKRGIFQGDSLSPTLFVIALIPLTLILRKATAGYHFTVNHLLFMDDLKLYGKDKAQLGSLTQTVHIFSHDTGMQFGTEKCAVLVLERGRLGESDGIKLPDDNEIKALKEGEGYKYLGDIKADKMLHSQMKEKFSKEYPVSKSWENPN